MATLLLASDASSLIEKAVKGGNMAYIPTAADLHETKWWIKEDKIKLTAKGFNLTEINLKRKLSIKEFKKFDVIFVAGGNTFYLLQKMRETGFDKIVNAREQKRHCHDIGQKSQCVKKMNPKDRHNKCRNDSNSFVKNFFAD